MRKLRRYIRKQQIMKRIAAGTMACGMAIVLFSGPMADNLDTPFKRLVAVILLGCVATGYGADKYRQFDKMERLAIRELHQMQRR